MPRVISPAPGGLPRPAMIFRTIQWKLRLPSFLGDGLRAGHFSLFGLFAVFLLSGPVFAQTQHAEPAPAVTVKELEHLAAVMED